MEHRRMRADKKNMASIAKEPAKRSLRRRNGLLNTAIPARSDLMAMAVRNSTQSPLLRLPGEIRTKIWQYALGHHRVSMHRVRDGRRYAPIRLGVSVRPMHATTSLGCSFVCPNFSLARVCRQVYAEAAAFAYSLNTFAFDSYATLDLWAKKRVVGQRRLVASIDMPYNYTQLYRLGFRKPFHAKFDNIQRIGVHANVAAFSRRSEADGIAVAKARVVEWIKRKEGEQVCVDWFPGTCLASRA
ncbi:hypothetical protein ACEQ8H_000829 [Pleosporales sp. CAS-2024a]